MRLCMFHPNDQPMERGWVGRIDGERVLHLAAQTLQSFFLGGGGAREHAEYALAEVTLLVPVLHPPAVRIFDARDAFAFANPTSVAGTGAVVAARPALALKPRVAAVIGAGEQIGGYTLYAQWLDTSLQPPKHSDFAAGLGPVVVTPDEDRSETLRVTVSGEERLREPVPAFDWDAARVFAAAGTELRPGDLLVGPAAGTVTDLRTGAEVAVAADGVGVLLAALG